MSLDSPSDSSKELPAAGKDNSPSSALPDNWDDAVDVSKSSPSKSIDEKNTAVERDDEDPEEQDDSVAELAKSKSRPKKNVEAANKIKKEHINLVIIGHVGKSLVLRLRIFY